MTHPPADPDKALREAVKTGNIVFVAGTGVSTSATFNPATKAGHPQASWIGLLKHGLDEAERMGQIKKGKADVYRAMLAEDPTTENLISAASTVTKAFGGVTSGIFKDWLENTIGKVCATNRNILDPLHALREAGNFLATTNYDDVLLDYRNAPQPITWMDGNDIVGALKNRERDKIIYLHGYWKRPESVILDGRSYQQIARDDEYRDDLAALWKTTTWVYVGCSESGITDPDLGLLLDRHGERARDAEHWDFCLVHKKDVSAFQKCFDDRKLNIVAVPYGDNHSALPLYLRSLLPAPVTDPHYWDKLHGGSDAWDHHSSLQQWQGIDTQIADEFLSKDRVRIQKDFLSGLRPIEQFRRFQFLLNDGTLSRGAFLCFTEFPSEIITCATTKCYLWKGSSQTLGFDRSLESRGGLLRQFGESLDFLIKSLRLERLITDQGRKEILEIPVDALEEAVANALVHREYHARASVIISVFDDRVEVISPGRVPPPLEISIINDISNSHPRNPQIARIFYLSGFVERAGSGLGRIKTALAIRGLPPPEFQETKDGCFKVIFRRPSHLPSTLAPVSRQSNNALGIPAPPAFYAEPDYIGSHKFVGRADELQVLTDWANPADPTNLLLFEAIGGNGKSMLTWEWTTNPRHALAARPADKPWAGRFWYSFYEHGAIMADFCQRALAYMKGRPLEDFANKKTADLKDELLAQLHARPWLLILDGLERILVAYHRIDAAEVPDEEANKLTDKIINRNPSDAIRDEDNDLLRALATAAPSKLLVSSRLTPRALLNPSGQPIPGAKRINLPGLRPPDAEALLRSCGIEGKSDAIQSYLTANCDNHPLVIGILGGLIANYLPARGDFDAWSAASDGGAALDLARLDLIQGRNHILEAAIKTLPDASRQLLSTLALLTDSVDYETLKAFNPHLPPEPEEVEKPTPPEKRTLHRVDGKLMRWAEMSDDQKAGAQKQYEAALARRQEYEKAVQVRLASAEFRAAPKKLAKTVNDLEQRGLLQWDGRTRKYDLHPVVRGVASGAMAAADRERHGQRVVDHFTAQPHRPYEEAETLEDVRSGLHVVRALLKLGHYQQAADAYRGALALALRINLNAYAEILSLLKPFFPNGWGELPKEVTARDSSYLATDAAIALHSCGELAAALAAYGAGLRAYLEAGDWIGSAVLLRNISVNLTDQNRLARALRTDSLALEVATLSEHKQSVFGSRLDLFADQSRLGQWAEAVATWSLLDPMGRAWSRAVYRPGWAEYYYATFHFSQGSLQEAHLAEAERLAAQGKDRTTIRSLHRLRGDWRLTQGEWALAAASYQEAVRLARDTRSVIDAASETGLALAKHHLGQLANPREEAERLAQLRDPAHRFLAQLWLALGDTEQAKKHALAAYKWAWADGEPYVHRYALTKTTELLHKLGVPIPNLPPYDPTKDVPLPWEADVRAAIEKLRAQKKAKQRKREESSEESSAD